MSENQLKAILSAILILKKNPVVFDKKDYLEFDFDGFYEETFTVDNQELRERIESEFKLL